VKTFTAPIASISAQASSGVSARAKRMISLDARACNFLRKTPRIAERSQPAAEAWREMKRKWRAENKEKVAAHKKTNYQRNRPAARARTKRWYLNNASKGHAYTLKKKHGLTTEAYASMFAQQEGRCAICREPPGYVRLAVDHDHGTGVIRGLLCDSCNRGIGFLQDSPRVLRAAAKYLTIHSQQAFDARKIPCEREAAQ
jgi:hypothetical protein